MNNVGPYVARLAPLLPQLVLAYQRRAGEIPAVLQGGGQLGQRHVGMLVTLAIIGPLSVSELAQRTQMTIAHASLVVGELARQYFNGKEPVKAVKMYELGRKAEPYENSWLIELAKIYRETKKDDKLIGVLIDLVPTDADSLDSRRLLAQLMLKAGRHAEAERYAREALEIDVLDVPSQQALEAALRAQNKNAEADELAKLLRQ